MGKWAPDAGIDAALDYYKDADLMIVCSAQPTDYNDAVNVKDLASISMVAGDFTKADHTTGRKVTVAAKSGATINHGGTPTHIALCKSGDSTLRYVTVCSGPTLVQGGQVNVPSWKMTLGDPV